MKAPGRVPGHSSASRIRQLPEKVRRSSLSRAAGRSVHVCMSPTVTVTLGAPQGVLRIFFCVRLVTPFFPHDGNLHPGTKTRW